MGINAEESGYRVSASDGVELIGLENGGYIAKNTTVTYSFNDKIYTSNPITEPVEINSENAEQMGSVTGSAVKITAGDGV